MVTNQSGSEQSHVTKKTNWHGQKVIKTFFNGGEYVINYHWFLHTKGIVKIMVGAIRQEQYTHFSLNASDLDDKSLILYSHFSHSGSK